MSSTGFIANNISYYPVPTDLINIFKNQISTGNTATGFTDSGGNELSDIFAPYNGGAKAPLTNYVSNNYSSDLNGVFTYFPFQIQTGAQPVLSQVDYSGTYYNTLNFSGDCSFTTTAPVNIEQIFMVGGGNSGQATGNGATGGKGGNGGQVVQINSIIELNSGISFSIVVGDGGNNSGVTPGSFGIGGNTIVTITQSGNQTGHTAYGGAGAAGGIFTQYAAGAPGNPGTQFLNTNLYFGGGGGGGGSSYGGVEPNGFDGGIGGVGGGGGGGGGGGPGGGGGGSAPSNGNGGNGGNGGGNGSSSGGAGGTGAQESQGAGNNGDPGTASQFGGGGGGGGQFNTGAGGYGGSGGSGGTNGGSGGGGAGPSDKIAGGGGGGGGGGGYGGGGGGGGYLHGNGAVDPIYEKPGNGGSGVVILVYNAP